MTNRFEHIPEATFVKPIDGENESSYEDLPSEKIRKALFDAVVQMGEVNGVPQEHLLVSGHSGDLYREGQFSESTAEYIDEMKREDAAEFDEQGRSPEEMTPQQWLATPDTILTDRPHDNPAHYAMLARDEGAPGAISLYDKRVLDANHHIDDESALYDTTKVYSATSEDLLENTAGILHIRGNEEDVE